MERHAFLFQTGTVQILSHHLMGEGLVQKFMTVDDSSMGVGKRSIKVLFSISIQQTVLVGTYSQLASVPALPKLGFISENL